MTDPLPEISDPFDLSGPTDPTGPRDGAGSADAARLARLDVELGREDFAIEVLTELVAFLQRVLGRSETAAFIDALGQRVGESIHQRYRDALTEAGLEVSLLPHVLSDLKRRIGGSFRVVEATPERIVLHNGDCPFGAGVRGRQALCRMTSNVFGTIVADEHGYARVELDETIADGASGCRVVIDLARGDEVDGDRTREYFAAPTEEDLERR